MRRYLPALIVFASVALLTLSGFIFLLKYFQTSVQAEFEESAQASINTLQRSLQEKLLLLESMHSLYAIFNGQPQPEFRRFVLPFEDELDGLQAMQWTVPVRADQRSSFEQARRSEGIPGYQIRERNAAGEMVPAGERALYFPIYPLLPIDQGDSSLGYDLASSPVRYEALMQAVSSGQLSISQGIDLLSGSKGFIAYKPLYRAGTLPTTPAERMAELLGLVLAVFDIGAIVEDSLATQPQQSIDFQLTDPQAAEASRLLFATSQSRYEGGLLGWQPRIYSRSLLVGNRQWLVDASPAADFMQGRYAYAAWFTLGVGLLLAYVLAFYLVEHTRNIESMKAAETQRQSLENQLLHSQKMDAIGRLVGGVAHDFNNLLTSMMGYAELASSETDREQQQAHLQQVIRGGEKGRSLIRKLLSFSRNEPVRLEPLHLPPKVENTVSMLRPVLTSSIELQLESEAQIPRVKIDPTSLDQVLVNLCINARDAINGRGRILVKLMYRHLEQDRCSSCQQELKGDYVILKVEDNGEGITPEDLKQIFQPFYSTKARDKGTGLGLSIIHSIVHACDGHILVSSTPGEGTYFRLLFPVADKHSPAALRVV